MRTLFILVFGLSPRLLIVEKSKKRSGGIRFAEQSLFDRRSGGRRNEILQKGIRRRTHSAQKRNRGNLREREHPDT